MNRRVEIAVVAALSAFAALRIFIFCAAFPVFSQTDEDMHFDLVLRYARGDIPKNFDRLAPDTLNWIVPYASPEFLQNPEQLPEGKFSPPLWKQAGPEADAVTEATRSVWSKEINWECSQPPLYYSVAALWWKLGRLMPISGISAIYWLRFLNAVLIAASVWLGYATARSISAGTAIFVIGVPFVVALFPQDVFFTINNDVLSAICGGLVFFCAVRALAAEWISLWLAASTGLAVASCYLTKMSNAPLATIAFIVVLGRIISTGRTRLARTASGVTVICLTALVPVAIWMAWTRANFGDLTGGTGKIGLLGWTMKPISQWWHHPIFTLHGLWLFWSDFAARYWRGEIMWHAAAIHWLPMDIFYSVVSLIVLAGAIFGLFVRNNVQRGAIALALLSFLASVGFLMVISIAFDFGRCIYPSRAYPYLTAGRLIIAELIPFAVLLVFSANRLLRLLSEKLPGAAILLTMALAVVSQIVLDSQVFGSEHNWFHR